MKLKHTQARKANTRAFRKQAGSKAMSAKRYAARWDAIKARRTAKSFGCHVVRIQRIFLKKDRFGAPIYKFVKHAAV